MQNLAAAALIAVALVVSAFLIGGRYEFNSMENAGAFRLDRLTGQVALCRAWEDEGLSCANIPERLPTDSPAVESKPR